MTRFGSVLTAMVTPFDGDGALDLVAATELARWLVAHGNDGLVLAGTTGESPTLDDDEKLALFAAVRAAVDVPLVAGATSNDTAHSVRLAVAAAETGVDGILAVTPYYNRPPQSGIEAHFRAIAAATDLPIVLYDVPVRTGRKLATETVLRLAHEVPTIVGLKDAAGHPAETARLIAEAPEGFEVISGDDSLTLALLALGATGVIGVATHWCAELTGQMVDAVAKGDAGLADSINRRLLASWSYETGDDAPNPIPAKVMMNLLGLPVGCCRLPVGEAPPDVAARLRQEAQRIADDLGLAIVNPA